MIHIARKISVGLLCLRKRPLILSEYRLLAPQSLSLN